MHLSRSKISQFPGNFAKVGAEFSGLTFRVLEATWPFTRGLRRLF
uniref:Uncharacterized protein n=1 Tax=Rhizophora mucronata TaxID=61149 RepID=A0A2P2NWI0_RHIMU